MHLHTLNNISLLTERDGRTKKETFCLRSVYFKRRPRIFFPVIPNFLSNDHLFFKLSFLLQRQTSCMKNLTLKVFIFAKLKTAAIGNLSKIVKKVRVYGQLSSLLKTIVMNSTADFHKSQG